MRHALVFAATLMASAPFGAQADSLADIRRDLTVLMSNIAELKAELEPSGGGLVVDGGSTYDRVIAIESELMRLTGATEELDFRVRQIVKDGTNRVGDLEFRICELEPNCDLGSLGQTSTLGGGGTPVAPAARPAPSDGSAQLAVGEEADYRRAQEALAKSDFRTAADQFAAFRQTYPGSPLEPEALMGLGEALEGQGDTREAARAFLDAFSGYPSHEIAPFALFKLGASLGALGKVAEACVTLGEVGGRYPASGAVPDATSEMARLGCS